MALSRLKAGLGANFLLVVVLASALGWYSLSGLRDISATLDTVYEDRVLCQEQLRIVDDALGSRVLDAIALRRDGAISAAQAAQRIGDARRDAAARWGDYSKTIFTPAEAVLVAAAEPALRRADAAAAEIGARLAAGAAAEVDAAAAESMRNASEPLRDAVRRLIALQLDVVRGERERAAAAYERAVREILLFVAAVTLIGGVLAAAVLARHGTEESTHARLLTRLNNHYSARSETNQLIVRVLDLDVLLNEICRICVEHGRVRAACVFLADGDLVTRRGAAGPIEELFRGMARTTDLRDPVIRQSLVATALREGRHAISQDYQREAPAAAWRARAAEAGIGAAAAFPLRRGGAVVGALALYASEAYFYDEALVRLLDGMAGDVSFALDNNERESNRLREQQVTEESLLNFRAAFQCSPVSAVITELDGAVVLEANDSFCEQYGVARAEIVGRTMGELGIGLEGSDRDAFRAAIARDGRVRNMELRTRLRGGGVATVLANTERIRYQGRLCLLSMTMDVTELRRAAAAREAQIEAEAANRAKTGFLSRMSHELRTPLNAMLGFTQLLRREARERLTARDLTRLEHIHTAGWHLLSLVNDVLDMSRIESGSLDVRPRDLALAPLLDEAMEMSGPMSEQSGIALRSAYRHLDPVGVRADPVRLRQVFINLLSNAIKYNRPGGSVHVEVHADAGRVTVAIVDTGMGMTGEQMEHLYEPFNRLGRERGGIEGTGLGLSLTRQLVRQMGGELDIESHVGRGTAARVSLARAAPPVRDARAVDAEQVPADPAEPHGTVLYIEDNEVNAVIVEQMLARWRRVRFVHAPDGRSGIERAAQLLPDLILLDMQLPDMDGFGVLDRLGGAEVTKRLHVVALSASAMPEDVERARAKGARDYWTKPLELEQFLDNVARVLARHDAFGQPTRQAPDAR